MNSIGASPNISFERRIVLNVDGGLRGISLHRDGKLWKEIGIDEDAFLVTGRDSPPEELRPARDGLHVALVNHNEHLGGNISNGLGVWATLWEGNRRRSMMRRDRRSLITTALWRGLAAVSQRAVGHDRAHEWGLTRRGNAAPFPIRTKTGNYSVQ